MKFELLYQEVLTQLRNRIPQNSKLVTKLIDILPLEKDAIYRRLRQEVPFTFEEIVIIAKEFNISLDSMLGVDTRPAFSFRFHSIASENAEEIDYLLLEEYRKAIKEIASASDGEISLVTNLMPHSFYIKFNFIYRFYYFKRKYYSVPYNQTKAYHEIVLPDRLNQIAKDIFVNLKNVKTLYYILDNRIFQNFVNDVIYFNSIRLIKDEDVRDIKDELFRFIDYMEIAATRGYADNPLNRIFIYISDTSIDTSYSYVDSKSSLRFALIWSFIFNSVLYFDEKTLDMMKYQIQSKIRTSTLLSVTGEKHRKLYFETQRKIVEEL
jgi:hypothetical protein